MRVLLTSMLAAAGAFGLWWSSGSQPRAPDGPLATSLRVFAQERRESGRREQLVYRVTQSLDRARVPALSLAVFQTDAHQLLTPVRCRTSRLEAMSRIVLTATISLDREVRSASSDGTLVFVVGGPDLDPNVLENQPFDALRQSSAFQFFREALPDQAAGDGASSEMDGLLLNAERKELRDGRVVDVFTRTKLPRVRARAPRSNPLHLRMVGPDGDAVELKTALRIREPYVLLDVRDLTDIKLGVPFRLQLCDRHGEIRREWPITWAPAPEDYPSIARSAQAQSSDEKLGILSEAQARGGWEAYFAEVELGRIYRNRGDREGAWASWDRARASAESLGSPTAVAGRLRSLAFLDLQGAEHVRAAAEIREAKIISESVGDVSGLSRAKYLEALQLDRREGPMAALVAKRRYLETIETSRSLGDDGDADRFALLLASLLAEYGSGDEARQWLKNIAPAPASRMWIDYAIHRANIERVIFEREEGSTRTSELRLELLRDLEAIARAPESEPSDRAAVLACIVRFDLALGELESAELHLRDLEKFSQGDLGFLRRLRPLLAAEVDLAAGRAGKVIRDLEAFRARLEESGEDGDLAAGDAAEALLGDAHLMNKDAGAAERSFRAAIDGREQRVFALSSPRARARYRAQFARAEQHLLELLIERGRDADAFEMSEWLRVRSILDLTAHARIARSPHAFDHFASLYHDLVSRYPRECSRVVASETKDCQALRTEVDVATEELSREMWGGRPDPRIVRSFRALDLVRAFPSETGILTLASLDRGRTASFFVRSGEVRTRIVEHGQDPVQPWLKEISGLRRLLVSPNHPATFELPRRSVDGLGALGGKLPVVMFTYGDEALPSSTSSTALIIADPDRTLLHAAREGDELRRRLSGAVLLSGDAATRPRVLALWNSDVIHFAGHAELIADDPWRPTLRLADDDIIALEDVLASPPRARLVVLNACGSGMYQEKGKIGLPDAFARGAEYVLASSTRSLEDGHAHELISDFYARGIEDPPEAYRQAIFASEKRRGVAMDFRLWISIRPPQR